MGFGPVACTWTGAWTKAEITPARLFTGKTWHRTGETAEEEDGEECGSSAKEVGGEVRLLGDAGRPIFSSGTV